MRTQRAGHRGCVVWFTGLSGSGKSTVANAVERKLFERGVQSYLLDGDNIRHGLSATPQMLAPTYGGPFAERFGLGFGAEDRAENIRRVAAVARLLCDAGLVTLTALVSPLRADRSAARASLAPEDFYEVFVDTPLEVCESRDPKGLYKKARAGLIPEFTGISAPYEAPEAADLVLPGGGADAVNLADRVLEFLASPGVGVIGDA